MGVDADPSNFMYAYASAPVMVGWLCRRLGFVLTPASWEPIHGHLLGATPFKGKLIGLGMTAGGPPPFIP